MTALAVDEGDVIRIHTGNGGGYGDPGRRSPARVLDDVRNGFVTAAQAAGVYAASDDVVLGP